MKTLQTIIAVLLLSSFAFSQNDIKIISVEDGTDYTGQTVNFNGDGITVGGSFYVINTSSTLATYKFGVLPISVSDPDFKFQFCELSGGSSPGMCYTCQEPIGSFWVTPSLMEDIAPGDSVKVEIKLNTALKGGTAKGNYYVLEPHNKGGGYDKIDSLMVEFSSTAALDQQEIPSFKIYPNPAKEAITIQGEALKNGGTVVFLNALGQEVKRVHLNEMHTMIDINTLKQGVYFVSISDENGTKSKVQRLIVQ